MTKQGLNNLFFVIGVVAVVVMILTFDVSFSELWLHLCKAGYWLIPILGIWFVVYGLNALAWQSIWTQIQQLCACSMQDSHFSPRLVA